MALQPVLVMQERHQVAVYSKIVKRAKCPVCQNNHSQIVGTESPEISVSLKSATFYQPPSSILECKKCGLLFRDVILSEAELETYYRVADFRKWEMQSLYPTEKAVLQLLKQLPVGAKILDYGCSSGRLLAGLVASYNCYGFEVNQAAACKAASKGLKMIESQAALYANENVFDAIVMVDVFEHFNNPLAEIGKLFKLLKPAGVFFIVTGNGDAPICRLDPAQFWYFLNVEHLCMLTRKHAEYLAAGLGAKIREWKFVCHYEYSLKEQLQQRAKHFSYWQFRNQTLFSKSVLTAVPVLRRARYWKFAPAASYTKDHVLLALEK